MNDDPIDPRSYHKGARDERNHWLESEAVRMSEEMRNAIAPDSLVEEAESPYEPSDIELVAAYGSVAVPELPEDRALIAYQAIIDAAPEHIRDDFFMCCAVALYREALIKAVRSGDVGQILFAQQQIHSLVQN